MANVPVPEPKINQDIAGCQPKQVDHLVALRLEVAEISMSAIVNLDFRRIAVVSSHLLKLVILPGNHTPYRAPQIEWYSRASIKRTRNREALDLSTPRLSTISCRCEYRRLLDMADGTSSL